MAAKKSGANYSILVDVELDTSSIQRSLNEAAKKTSLNLDVKSKGLTDLNADMEDTYLTFQAANMIFNKTIDIISAMTSEVYALDTALTEFKKVSDLSGAALDEYVVKLNEMGSAVARTGKPWCLSRGDGMVNQHREQFKIQ